MHARAAAQFVQLASSFSSHIEIEKDKRRVNGKSIMGVMMLAAETGAELRIRAEGPDEREAVEALVRLIESRFDESAI